MVHGKRLVLAAAMVGVCVSARADEGMWLFNNPPKKLLKEKHGFDATDEWLEHVRKASVRFNSGGSGSFVSSNGLVMTNHHVGADTLQKIGTKEKDYLKTGFYAKSPDGRSQGDRPRTQRAHGHRRRDRARQRRRQDGHEPRRRPEGPPRGDQRNRKGIDRKDEAPQRRVTLYQGGAYHLYRYKKYTDVRLVFAPEKDIAFFGGDPDNFEFPRYDLDVCFFRVYENGKPAKIEHFLKWSAEGCKEGELTFVSGHPGRTNRLNTIRHLEYIRDKQMPAQLALLRRREVLLKTFSDRSLENARRAQDELFGIQNSRKARIGGLGGLQDPAFFGKKRGCGKGPSRRRRQGSQADRTVRNRVGRSRRRGGGRREDRQAIQLLRTRPGVQQRPVRPRPNDRPHERRTEAAQQGSACVNSAMPAWNRSREQLFADSPIYKDLETVKLADSLAMLVEEFGAEDPLVSKILAGKSPTARAAELVNGSNLDKVAARKELAAPKTSTSPATAIR